MMASKPKRRPASAMAELREDVRVEGARAAYRALVEICSDPKASSQARATASTTLFRAAGMLERFEDDLDDIEPGEATWDQLQRMIARNAQERGAPEELIEAALQVSSAAPEQESRAVPARRPRRAAGKPATAKAGPLDEFG